jgi:hypothetical protein
MNTLTQKAIISMKNQKYEGKHKSSLNSNKSPTNYKGKHISYHQGHIHDSENTSFFCLPKNGEDAL